MSLYRKYRPGSFSHLVGQDHVNRTLLNALKLSRISHAYLFTGPRGTGKTSTARLLAKAINCLNPKDFEPCNECEICNEINEGRLIDLIEIDAASNRGIDEIRDLKEKINFAPTRARSKVYIIDEVHMLTKEAFNALLKTLEEPPAHVFFILATTEVHKIPETILSRCQRFDFRRIDESTLVNRLEYIAEQEGIEADKKALELIAHHSEGGMRDAIGLLEQLTTDNKLLYSHVCEILGVSGIASLEKLFGVLTVGNAKEGLGIIDDLFNEGFDLTFFNKRFLEYLRKEMVKSVSDGGDPLKIVSMIDYFREAQDQARFTVIPQLPLEVAVVKSCSLLNKNQHDAKPMPSSSMTAPKIISQAAAVPDISVPRIAKADIADIPGAETPMPAPKAIPISLGEVNDKWNDFLDQIKLPVVKRSLQQTKPLSMDGVKLVLSMSSNFTMEKLMETDNRNGMEKAFEEFFGAPVKIEGEIKKTEVHPQRRHEGIKTANEIPPVTKTLEETAIDIFEGEMI